MSVATWSLRERAVCSFLPTSPMRAVSALSMFMCTSSRPTDQVKRPASMSARMALRPSTMRSRSSAVSTPTAESIVACAIEPWMSCA